MSTQTDTLSCPSLTSSHPLVVRQLKRWDHGDSLERQASSSGLKEKESSHGTAGHLGSSPGLDDKTELLTRRGWLSMAAIGPDDLVANWRSDGAVCFERPISVIRQTMARDERMVCIQSKTINLRVTESYRMLVRNRNCLWKSIPSYGLRTGLELPAFGLAEPDPIKIPQPEYSITKRRLSANAYNLRKAGVAYEDSFRVAAQRAEERAAMQYTQPHELSPDECRFIGFWIADGSRNRLQSGGVEYTLCQSTRYQQIIAWVDRVILQCGFDAIKRLKPAGATGLDYHTWSLPRGTGFGPQRRRGVFRLEPYLNKDGSDYLWGLSESQFDAVCEGYWLGDGFHGLFEQGVPSTLKFADTNRQWIDLLCAIGCVRNWRCSIGFIRSRNPKHKDQWRLTMVKHRPLHISCRTPVSIEANSSQVIWSIKTRYCGVITRRDGHVTVLGNPEVQETYSDLRGIN